MASLYLCPFVIMDNREHSTFFNISILMQLFPDNLVIAEELIYMAIIDGRHGVRF